MSRRADVRIWSVLFLLFGCASSGTAVPGAGVGSERMSDPDFILRDEIVSSNANSAYALVRDRRPQWLQTRGLTTVRQAAGQDGIKVYMDNARLGDLDAMRGVGLASVEYLQFFTAREATQRWGAGHLNGAILISTQPR